jgi:ElaB/YqjD/DUF883 family membrane-anchored ribosome-binding protein
MMNDTPSSNNAGSAEACVTKAGEAIGERVQSATAATAAAAGHAQKIVQDATAATIAAASQAKKRLGDAGEIAQQAWSQASTVAGDVVDGGRRAARSVSRQIHENPLMSVLVGVALGYVAGWWLHGGGGRPRTTADDKAQVKRSKGAAPEPNEDY